MFVQQELQERSVQGNALYICSHPCTRTTMTDRQSHSTNWRRKRSTYLGKVGWMGTILSLYQTVSDQYGDGPSITLGVKRSLDIAGV